MLWGAIVETGEVGSWIRGQRRRFGLTQRQLGRRVMVERSLVCLWESGRRRVQPQHLRLLRNLFEDLGRDRVDLPPDMSDEQWISWVRAWRLANGVSVADLAARIPCNPVSVYRWERGINPVPRWAQLAIWRLHLSTLGSGGARVRVAG